MEDDEPSDSTTIIKKILGAKLFDDETGAWKKDVRDIEGEVLCGQSYQPEWWLIVSFSIHVAGHATRDETWYVTLETAKEIARWADTRFPRVNGMPSLS